ASSLLVGSALALWLDRGIVAPLRGIERSLAAGQMIEPRGMPRSRAWGELAGVMRELQALLPRHRQLIRTAEELQALQLQLETARRAIERWAATERWEAMRAEGPLRALIEALDRGFGRHAEVLEQNREAALQVRND